ncbi:hypothetical protein EMIT0P294_80214 [Pseudomonas sp. IT-P294]
MKIGTDQPDRAGRGGMVSNLMLLVLWGLMVRGMNQMVQLAKAGFGRLSNICLRGFL